MKTTLASVLAALGSRDILPKLKAVDATEPGSTETAVLKVSNKLADRPIFTRADVETINIATYKNDRLVSTRKSVRLNGLVDALRTMLDLRV